MRGGERHIKGVIWWECARRTPRVGVAAEWTVRHSARLFDSAVRSR